MSKAINDTIEAPHAPCEVCGDPVIQRDNELRYQWRRRRSCSKTCGDKLCAPPKRIDRDEVRRLADAGRSPREIAAAVGCYYDSIYRIAREEGIVLPRGVALGFTDINERAAFWREQGDAELRRLVDDGLTASEAARKLGVTKNAVIGRAHRLGLIWARSPIADYEPAKRDVTAFPEPGCCTYAIEKAWCGEPVKPRSSYCETHHSVVFRPARPMKDAA